MELDLFLGRFHPLIVHFPIALLIAAGAIEFLSKLSAFRKLLPAQPFVIFLGTASAVMSVILGLLVSGDRGYDQTLLDWHKWSGFLVVGLSIIILLITTRHVKVSERVRKILFLILLIVVSLTGHLGGSLTHGEDYLSEYAPGILRGLLSPSKQDIAYQLPESPDSVNVYSHLIKPIINKNCTSCHDSTQRKGGLSILTSADIIVGGDNGSVIKPGNALESELFRRITLPPGHSKFMPLRKTPLSFAEVTLIRWWIDQGASFNAKLSELELNEDIITILMQDFDYDPTPQPYYIRTRIDSVSSSLIEEISMNGFIIKKLAADNNFLSVAVSDSVEVDSVVLSKLHPIKDNITWLDLSSKNIQWEDLRVINNFHNLTILNISQNPITDEGIAYLKGLHHLETLNLYGSDISDESIRIISAIASLKRVYLWQTRITKEGIELLTEDRPNLIIDYGHNF